jgi:hypothetical protein
MDSHAPLDDAAVGAFLLNNTNDFFRHFVIHCDWPMQAHVFGVSGQRMQPVLSTTWEVATIRNISQSCSTAGMHCKHRGTLAATLGQRLGQD